MENPMNDDSIANWCHPPRKRTDDRLAENRPFVSISNDPVPGQFSEIDDRRDVPATPPDSSVRTHWMTFQPAES